MAMFEPRRENRDVPVTTSVNSRMAPVAQAIRRVMETGRRTKGVKAEILSLCRAAKRRGTPVEVLVADLHRMLDRQELPWRPASARTRELRQVLVWYLIATYRGDAT
jgi:hypothetical protein